MEILIGKRDFGIWKTLNSAWVEIGPRPVSTGLAQRPNQSWLAHATRHVRGAPATGCRTPGTGAGAAADGGSVAPP
jgi:hypothetical protein